nr:16S rRNA (cytosine(967)-C(5))-methyltransferase RsmB [Pseudomonadales bacterium]
ELRHNWPDAAEQVLEANNQLPPMTLRVNRTKCSRDEYLQRLVLAGISCAPLKWSSEAIGLEHPVDVEQLPEFQAGFVSVQDVAAQFAARLVDVRQGHRVLDACAAPGGKTSHILESNSSLEEMVAVDVDPARVARISQNLARLGLQATVVTGDLMNPGEWWDGRLFDRILLDVPCSATGVIRRHPDIKILRRPNDVDTLSDTQRELLEMGWSMLAPSGMLVYSTCSVLPKENHEQIETFIESRADVQEKSIETDWGIKCSHGRQILPGESLMDGFYYACLLRTG